MYHSVTFGSKNSYTDWHLVPDGRPVIAMPEVKTNYVEVPGLNGVIDLSETLTKYPTYGNRTGDLTFHVLNGYRPWQELYQEIANYVHGKRINLSLEDDPDYYYNGRVSISEWTSNNDGTWSDISFSYELDPYKYAKTEYSSGPVTFNSNSTTYTYTTDQVGRMPVSPTITVSGVGTSGITVVCNNPELGISNRSRKITTNSTFTFYDMLLSKMNTSNNCRLTVSGQGTVTIRFRRGEL